MHGLIISNIVECNVQWNSKMQTLLKHPFRGKKIVYNETTRSILIFVQGFVIFGGAHLEILSAFEHSVLHIWEIYGFMAHKLQCKTPHFPKHIFPVYATRNFQMHCIILIMESELVALCSMYVDYSTYIINYLDQDYVPLYPLSITCSSDSDSFSLAECSSRYVDSEFTATALYTVGIRCQHEGKFHVLSIAGGFVSFEGRPH